MVIGLILYAGAEDGERDRPWPCDETPRMIPAEFPSLMLTSSDGARAEFALDGGHVVSWTPAGQTEDRLFVSARSTYGPGNAIRGGIPVIFPQFGPFGALKQHGFARNRRWTVVDSSNESSANATLRLTDDAATRALWPHRFDGPDIVQIVRLAGSGHGARREARSGEDSQGLRGDRVTTSPSACHPSPRPNIK